MDLNLRRLQVLREVAQHGGVTAAARAMHFSPSGVSQQMSALEQDVGAAVLERRGRNVVLTPLGRVLLAHAETLLDAERTAQAEIEEARASTAVDLVVGVYSTVAAGLVPQIHRALAASHPEIVLRTREIEPEEASVELRHGHLDVSFLIDYPESADPWPTTLRVVPLFRDALHLAAPAGRFEGGRVRLEELADQDWVISGPRTHFGRYVHDACLRAGFEISIAHQVDEQSTALAMVAAGMGVTLVSDLGLTFVPTHGADVVEIARPLRREMLLGHEITSGKRPAVRAFVEAARAASPAGAGRRTLTDSQHDADPTKERAT